MEPLCSFSRAAARGRKRPLVAWRLTRRCVRIALLALCFTAAPGLRPPPYSCSPYGRTNTQTGGAGTFYFSNAEPYDWTTPQNNALWQDAAKTLFDPCPAGWRVPKAKDKSTENPWAALNTTNGPWQEVTTVITGRLFDTSVVTSGPAWYPTTGRRSPSNGKFSVYGTHGQYWTTSVTGIVGNRFGISGVGVGLDTELHYRTYGYPVRCIRE